MRRWIAIRVPGRPAALVAATLLVYALLAPGPAPRAEATAGALQGSSWPIEKQEGGKILAIHHNSSGGSPQVAALHLESGYFRLVAGTTFGTSIVLPPVFWSNGVLTQGMPITAETREEGDRLIIEMKGEKNGLKVTLKVTLKPPGDGRIEAEVEGKCENSVPIDSGRPGEGFKPIMLSSMRIGCGTNAPSPEWDARAIIVEGQQDREFDDAVGSHDFFLRPSENIKVRRFGFRGGRTRFQAMFGPDPAPTVEILFPEAVPIAGYRSLSCNHDDDNLAFWAGYNHFVDSWRYIITAMRPAD